MPDYVLASLRGGVNQQDTPIAVPDDQCLVAMNVEFTRSTLGERRLGARPIDLTGSGLAGHERVTFLYRHLPTAAWTDSELWALGVTGTSSASLARKLATWQPVTMPDAPILTGEGQFAWAGQTLHGKLFLAYPSGVDRLHVWDGTTLRRAGLAAPTAAPTVTNTGSGTFGTTRYYRFRLRKISGPLRSEPGPMTTFTPSGTGAGAAITVPPAMAEGSDQYEIEASTDRANWYRILYANPGDIPGGVFTDTTPASPGYAAAGFPLAAESGDYTPPYSARFVVADDDRLLLGGAFNNAPLDSRVSWTPVYGDVTGIGNDERIPVSTVNFIDLDTTDGGRLTGLSRSSNGAIWAFKASSVYKLVRTGVRSRAYEAIAISKERGAVPGSVVEAVDQVGRPSVYFLDPRIGPCRIGANGLQTCGIDILPLWREHVSLDADEVNARTVYYPDKQQVHWWVPIDGASRPNYHLVLHTAWMRDGEDGGRKGWVLWDGRSAYALTTCLYAANIDANASRSRVLQPFIGVEGNGLIWRCDTGDQDYNQPYQSRILTKPVAPANILNEAGVMAASVLAKAQAGAKVDVALVTDFGLGRKAVDTVDLTPSVVGEEAVIRPLDNLSLSPLRTFQLEIVDPPTPGVRWEVNQLVVKVRREQTG
jgi:hypothetical protein